MKEVKNQIKQLKQSSSQEEHQSQDVPTIENSNMVKHISNAQVSKQEGLKNEKLNEVITVDSLKIFTEDSVQYKSSNGAINLAKEYKLEYCLDDENVKALAEYEYALLSGKTVEQSRTEFTLINVADSTVILGWSEENRAARISQIEQAISVGTTNPVFFIIADGLHIVTIGLLPDLNTGVIQVVYMNSAYGRGSEEYIASKMTGLIFLSELYTMVCQTNNPLDVSRKLQAQISQVYLNPTQQLINNCGVMTGFNIASLAKYWKDKAGVNFDFNELGNYIRTLPHNILIASEIQQKEQQFEAYVRNKFQAIENLRAVEIPGAEPGMRSDVDVIVTVNTLTVGSINQKYIGLKAQSEERMKRTTSDFSCIEKQALADVSYLKSMIFEMIIRNRELTRENIGSPYTETEIRAAYDLLVLENNKLEAFMKETIGNAKAATGEDLTVSSDSSEEDLGSSNSASYISSNLAIVLNDPIIALKQTYKDLYAKIQKFNSGCFGLTMEKVLNQLSVESEDGIQPLANTINSCSDFSQSLLLRDFSGIGLYTLAYHIANLWAHGKILQKYHAVVVLPVEQMHKLGPMVPEYITDLFKIWDIKFNDDIVSIKKKDILVIVSGFSDRLRLYTAKENQELEKSLKIGWLAYAREFDNIIITNSQEPTVIDNTLIISLEPFNLEVEHLKGTSKAVKCYVPGKVIIKEAEFAVRHTFSEARADFIGEVKTVKEWCAQAEIMMQSGKKIDRALVKVDHTYPTLNAQEVIELILGIHPHNAIQTLTDTAKWFCAATTPPAPNMKDFAAYCVASYFMARRLSDNYVDNLGEIDDVIQKATLKMPEGVQIILQELNTDSTFSQLDTKSLLTLMGAKKRTLEQEKTIKRMSKSELSKYKALIKLFEKPLEEISGQLKRMPYGEISDKIGMEVTEQVTMAVRTILKGEGLGGLHYLTLGITAVLIAETSRYPVSFLVTLCMLDLIQLHTEEEKAVWKVFFAQNHGKASTLEGGVMLDILQTIGGMHPMTQGNSYYQVREYSPKLKHGMHWVDFKSHIILMKWLSILIENEQDLNPHLTAEITIKPEGNTNIVDDLNSWFGMNDMGALNPYVFDRFVRKLDTFDSMLLEKREPIRNIFPNNQADFEDFFESSMQYLGMMKSRLPTPVGHVIVDTIILPTIIGRLRLAYNQEPVDKESIKEITRCYAGVVSRDPYFYQAEFLLASIKLHCASSKEYNEEEFIEIFQIITHAILNIEKVGMGKELLYHDMLNLRDECAAKIKLELEKRFDVEVLLINGEASILFREEKFKEALNKYFEALQKLEEYKIFFPEVIGDLLENIGDTYSALNQPGLAIEKFKESLDEHMRYGPNDRAFCIPKKIVEQSGKLTCDRNEELKQEIKFILDSFKDKVGNHDLRLIPIKKLLISIYLVFHEYAEAIILFKEIGKENLSKKDKELWGGVEQKAQSAAQVIDSSTVVSYCNFIEYDNVVLNHPMGTKLLSEAFKIAGGAGVNLLLDLGQDSSIAKQIFLAVQEQGANAVLNRLLGLDVVSEDQNTQQSVLSSEYYSLDDKGTTAESSTQDLIVYGARLDTTEPLTDSNSYTSADSRASIFGHKFYNTFGWYLKQIIYHKEISQFKKILQRNNIDKSIDILLKDNHLNFKKSVLLKLHPDKGGNNEDFASIQNIQEKFNTPLDIKGLVDEKIRTIQPVIHKATIGFKVLDTVVDSGRLIYKPTLQNTKKAVLDCAYLYSMYQGINGVSVVISGSEAIYQIYQGEYTQAFQTVATTIAYTALPSILVYTAIPYLGVTYGTAIAIYTAYIAIVNSYSFYIERTSDVESILRSTMAYRDLTKTLSESPLQQIYDFVSITKGYEVELDSMALVAEKEALKSKLVEEKGEFGQKLYNYIYGSLIEERYNLLNKVELGEITQEVAENLKAKHMKVTLGNQSYEHCMEIRHIENNISRGRDISAEHYYCYDDKQKILDYVLIGDNHFEVVERL